MFRVARVLLIVVALFAMPAAAQAATPFTAGSGEQPSVAVGSDGMGHVAWVTTEANAKVGYCRVSPGASACNRTELLNFGAATNANPQGKAQVFAPTAGKVVVVAGCDQCLGVTNRTYRWISTDNGASFGEPPVEIGNGLELGTSGSGFWLDEPANIFIAASGSRVKAEAGATSGTGVGYVSQPLYTYGPQVVRVWDQEQLVAATNNLHVIKYGVYNYPGGGIVATVNDDENWLTNRELEAAEPDNSESSLNRGPSGVFLTYLSKISGDERVGLRRFDEFANVFRTPTYIEGPDPIEDKGFGEPDSYQDLAGRVHVVWDTLHSGGRLRYTVSNTSAGGFSTPATLVKSESFNQPEIAAGPAGTGFVTWTPGSAGAIRVVPILPEAESGSAPPLPPDATSPRVTGFDVGDTTLRPGQKTKFTFRASEAGNAVLTFEKRFNGIKGKKKRKGKAKARTVCLPLTKKRLRALRKKAKSPQALRRILKKKRCRGFRRIGQIRQKVKAGVNSIAFNGRIAGQKLKPGHYRASLVITDSAGNVSRTERVSFRVVGQKKKKRRATR